jgi:hypothetical protein
MTGKIMGAEALVRREHPQCVACCSPRSSYRWPNDGVVPAGTGRGSAPTDNTHRSKKRVGVVMAIGLGKPYG